MSVPSYPFNSLPLKLPNKRMGFSFPPSKLPNKGMREYSKMILFIPFHSIPSSQAKPKGIERNECSLLPIPFPPT